MAHGLRDVERVRERVLDAALDELAARGLGGLTIEAAARRAGFDAATVRQLWPNSADLSTAALMEYGARNLPVPDTGTLYGDLLAYSKSFADMINSPIGRRLLNAVIAKPMDWDLSESRPMFLERRDQRMAQIVTRAIARDECVSATEPGRLVDMVAFGICLPILLYDRQVTDEDCEYVVRTLVEGIKPR